MARRRDPKFEIHASDRTRQGIRSAKAGFTSLGKAVKRFGVLFGVALGAETARRLLMVADNLKALQIRVKTATSATGDHVAVWERLRSIAQTTGAEMTTVVSTFQDLARVKTVVQASNEEILTLTRTVNQLGVIGGSTTEQLRFGMRQFNQAMSQPFFRAEEFNSLLENIPEVAARIAKGFELDQGALRQMVIEGKLASKEVFEKLLNQSAGINDEFALIPVTLQRAMSQLKTAASQVLRDLDQAAGLSTAIAKGVVAFTKGIRPTGKDLEENLKRLVLLEVAQQGVFDATKKALAEANVFFRGGAGQTRGLERRFGNIRRQLAETKKAIEEAGITLLDFNKKTGRISTLIPSVINPKINHELREKNRKIGLAAAARLLRMIEKMERDSHRLRIAQALGFVDVRAKLMAEREIQLLRASLQTKLAIEQGFDGVKQQREAELLLRHEANIFAEEQQRATGFTREQEQEREHNERMAQIRIEAFARRSGINKDFESELIRQAQVRRRFEEATSAGRVAIALGEGVNILSAFSGNSKRIFKLQKQLALAQIAVALPPSIIESYRNAGGYPLGIFAAVAMAAAGAAQIQAVRSATFGGGGGVRNPGAGGAGAGPAATPQLPAPNLALAEIPTRIVVQILGDIISREEQEDLIVRIIKERTDADEIFITAGSAQAVVIREGT